MHNAILHSEHDGIAFTLTPENRCFELEIHDVSVESIAFSKLPDNTGDITIDCFQLFVADKQFHHFRTNCLPGNSLSFVLTDISEPYANTINLFYTGDGTISVHCHKSIDINKNNNGIKNPRKSFIPSKISSNIDFIENASPESEESIGYLIQDALVTKERLIALSHDVISPSLESDIHHALKTIDMAISKFKITRKRLSKTPNFEAEKRRHLIDLFRNFMISNGHERELSAIESAATRAASSGMGQQKQRRFHDAETAIASHSLHKRMSAFFQDGPPTPLPMLNCKLCGNKPYLTQSKNPNTRKKRYSIACKECGNHPTENFFGRASNALYHWTIQCSSMESRPERVAVLRYHPDADGAFYDYAMLLEDYLNLYNRYLDEYQSYHDSDSAEYIAARKGKVAHIKDGILIAKRLQKHMNNELNRSATP